MVPLLSDHCESDATEASWRVRYLATSSAMTRGQPRCDWAHAGSA
eukprot:CAMPEP_0185203378 /NCGR_PEP_ID=MMETSP1140-20130426/52912_1 /TAXON_ID=298111 /ORGANISM="Pavlova sp., Strain CCMP459" /LENGTH=44 /DNA_ID= /DNA_START= /DNA_END= /DNA_ORIENTATION=